MGQNGNERHERWKEWALGEVTRKEQRVQNLETKIMNLGSRLFNLEYGGAGREGRTNYDKIARLQGQYQELEERKRRINDDITRLQTQLYG